MTIRANVTAAFRSIVCERATRQSPEPISYRTFVEMRRRLRKAVAGVLIEATIFAAVSAAGVVVAVAIHRAVCVAQPVSPR